MARIIDESETLTLHPVSIDGDRSEYASIQNENNMYTESSSTSYATINLKTGSGAVSYVYLEFDFEIPSGATINSITCKAKAYASTTNAKYIPTRELQLFSGELPKGSVSNFSNTASEITLTPGTWTAEELNELSLRMCIGRGTAGTTSTSYYARFYGATLTITYSIHGTMYEVTSSSNVPGITVSPTSEEVFQNLETEIRFDGNDVLNYKITDNNIDIINQIEQKQNMVEQELEGLAQSYTTGGSISGGSSYIGYPVGYSAENPHTYSSNIYAASGKTGYAIYSFDFSSIPANAEIMDIIVNCSGQRENATIDSTHIARIGLYSGETLKSTEQEFTSTGQQLITIVAPGTGTRAELQNAKLRFTFANYGGRLYGITGTVIYEIPGTGYYYLYTISNISADHVILVDYKGALLYIKENGSGVAYSKIYKKINGSWVQQTDPSIILDINTKYKKEN